MVGINHPYPPHPIALGDISPIGLTYYNNLIIYYYGKFKFLRTLTVEQFKAKQLVDRLLIKKNPKTSTFFSFGAAIGAVSSKGIPKLPMVSAVETPKGRYFLVTTRRRTERTYNCYVLMNH